MEMKQVSLDYKSMLNPNSIKRLIYFVHNLEEKLSSIKLIHDKLHELIAVVSKTHEAIIDELTNIKTVLNETIIEQEEDEMIPIDGTKSEWDDDDDDDDDDCDDDAELQSRKLNKIIHREPSPLIRRTGHLILNSASSNESSSIIENNSNSSANKRSSNLKRTDRSSSRTRSPKSVTFSLDENSVNQQQSIKCSIEGATNDTKNEASNQVTTPITCCSHSDSSKQNHCESIPKFEKIITNIRIHEIESRHGDYLRLINLSNSDDYDLSGHYLQQTISTKPLGLFRFPFNTVIGAGHTVTIWCGPTKNITPQPPHVFLWKEQKKWEIGPQCLTTLVKPNGQSIAWFRNSFHIDIDQSSSDILYVHSKSSTGSSDVSSNTSSSIKKRIGFSKFNLIGNNKPPFAHSPNSSIHPDHNGTIFNNINDLRSQINHKVSIGVTQLLNRPKSSPFASHTGCKQDLISRSFLRTQQVQQQQQQQHQKQTTIKT
ncbi:unnamed protein product [Rotaria socialis]|uniref:LTD domain-containing protein n=1 Tax=Rotaria socialis TaxID=392032 RepID=A0A818K8Y6_9BILA|nr:unnamed protein product [Rotaria socialis]CAF4691128.1 unnamed protein product [Rotaria socialis]